ncbi:MAG: membrane-bound lytic murein transglycosylase MltF [Nitrosomonas sp.]|nr:membrane-bound lytic murein transglycosylase MltF [Nitrosomonas sp.]
MRVFVVLFILFFSGFALTGCGSYDKPVPPFGVSDELVVITVEHAENFYQNPDGSYSGLTFDLVVQFARELGVKVRFIIMQQPEAALAALSKQRGHIVVGLDRPDELSRFRLGPVYKHTHHQVAFNTQNFKPKDLQQLVGKKVEVSIGSMQEQQLKRLKQSMPDLTWSAVDLPSDRLLEKLAKEKIEYAVANATQIKQAKHFHTNIDSGLELEAASSQWIFPRFVENELLSKARDFFARIQQDGALRQLLDNYKGHLHQLQVGDIRVFQEKIRTKLPNYQKDFIQAEELTEIDWRLIAALSYQESHWNPRAKSTTGVRGMMMLTLDTAKRMNVTSRLDAQQNILAGARYLQILKNKLPESVVEPDRTWIALAAYNQGYGHIVDARALARRFDLNPDLWVDLKKTLPLLSKPQYFETLTYGRTRGSEAVTLTESVRAYYKILRKNHTR